MLEIYKFFRSKNSDDSSSSTGGFSNFRDSIVEKAVTLGARVLSRDQRVNLKIDINAPYFVFPESGSVQEWVHFIFAL